MRGGWRRGGWPGRPRRVTRPEQGRAATIVLQGEWPQPLDDVARVVTDALHQAGLCGCHVPTFAVWARYDGEDG